MHSLCVEPLWSWVHFLCVFKFSVVSKEENISLVFQILQAGRTLNKATYITNRMSKTNTLNKTQS